MLKNLDNQKKIGVVVPVANESENIILFCNELLKNIKNLKINASVFFVVDNVSTDNTKELLLTFAKKHIQIKVIYEPKNKNVVDAYVRGFKEAIKYNCDFIIEMDSGFSHLPQELYKFVQGYKEGYDCVFGVRPLWSFKYNVPFHRRIYSLGGTILSNSLLGTHFIDMTSGYEGFKKEVLKELIKEPLKSIGHFYQTELRFKARNYRYKEVNITYNNPTPRVKWKYIYNAFETLFLLASSKSQKKIS
jgi:dolichol-phosphate mannosyltransferase